MNLTIPLAHPLIVAAVLALAGLVAKWIRAQHRLREELQRLHKQVRASYDVSRRLLHEFTHGSLDHDTVEQLKRKVNILSDVMWAEEGHVGRRFGGEVTKEMIGELLGEK